MNLIQTTLAPNLDKQEQEIVLAKNGDRISAISENECKKLLLVLIGKTHLDCGMIQDTGAINITINSLHDIMVKYFYTLTMSEITQAFRLGTMGEFGEWFGLNNKTYMQWCKGYLGWQKRIEANKKQIAFQNELNKPKELTQSEKDKIVSDGVLVVFYEFKRTGFVYDAGNVTYNYLDSKGLIPFTIERKKEIVKLAEAKVRLSITDKMASALSEIERNALKSKLGSVSLKDNEVRSECKRIGLNIFFKELVETETELKDLL